MSLDLDAARADKDREPLIVHLDGRDFLAKRPLEMRVIVAAGDLQDGDMKALKRVVDGMFGDQADAILDAGLTFDDIPLLMEALIGGGEGESDASTG